MTQPTVQAVRTAIAAAAQRSDAVRLAAVKAAQDIADQRATSTQQNEPAK